MQLHNDNPLGMQSNFATESNFNFAVNSPFVASWGNFIPGGSPSDSFLLSDNTNFLLSDGTFFLLST